MTTKRRSVPDQVGVTDLDAGIVVSRGTGPAPEIAVTIGLDGLVRACNGRFMTLTGLATVAISRTSIFEVVHPWDIPLVLEALAQVRQSETTAVWEGRVVNLKGEVHIVSWTAKRAGADRVDLRGDDVTRERRHAPQINADGARLRLALAIANAAAWDYDIDADRVTLDPSFSTLFGIAEPESVRTWADLASHVVEIDRPRFLAAGEQLTVSDGLSEEFRLQHIDGAPQYVAMRARVLNAASSVRSAVGVAWDITNNKAVEAELLQLALNDALTGIANRRAFDLAVDTEWARARRHGSDLAFIMVDVDNFKLFNDTFGHEAGDHVLTRLADTLRSVIKRPTDVIARYGGEEFAVLLPDTDAIGAHVVATLMVRACRERAGGPTVTISAGSAARLSDDESPWEILRRADIACYRAKNSGKDRAATADGT